MSVIQLQCEFSFLQTLGVMVKLIANKGRIHINFPVRMLINGLAEYNAAERRIESQECKRTTFGICLDCRLINECERFKNREEIRADKKESDK